MADGRRPDEGRSRFTQLLLGLLMAVGVACDKSGSELAGPGQADSPASQPASGAGGDEPLNPEPGTQVVALDVQGMHCEGCVAHISQTLQGLPGIRQVRVSLARKRAWVMLDRAGGPAVPDLIRSIAAIGYRATAADAPSTQPR